MLVSDLVPYAQAAVNGPGGVFFDTVDEDGWAAALTNAFWTARLKGFFPDYRIGFDNENIVNVNDPSIEMDRLEGQVIILFAAYSALKSKLASITTKTRAKAGPVESERQRSAQLLTELLKQTWQEIENITEELAGKGRPTPGFADLVLIRQSSVWTN